MVLVAITTSKPGGLDAKVSGVFENAPTLTFVDTDTGEVEVVEVRTSFLGGTDAPRLVLERGARFVITGVISPMSYAYLAQAGITVVPGMAGVRAEEALKAATEISAQPPWPGPYPQASPTPYQMPFQAQAPMMPPMAPPDLIRQQKEMLEFQKWVLERQLEILERQKEILQRQLLMIKKRLDELEGGG